MPADGGVVGEGERDCQPGPVSKQAPLIGYIYLLCMEMGSCSDYFHRSVRPVCASGVLGLCWRFLSRTGAVDRWFVNIDILENQRRVVEVSKHNTMISFTTEDLPAPRDTRVFTSLYTVPSATRPRWSVLDVLCGRDFCLRPPPSRRPLHLLPKFLPFAFLSSGTLPQFLHNRQPDGEVVISLENQRYAGSRS